MKLKFVSPDWVAASYSNTARWLEEQAVLARIHKIRTGEAPEVTADEYLETRDELIKDMDAVLAGMEGPKVVSTVPRLDEAE